MGCGSCGTGNACGTGGCKSGGCATGGCNKLNTFDWFSSMLPPDTGRQDEIFEVRFKSTHKGFYKNVNSLDLITGDVVVVESDRGYDTGTISLSGELAKLQMRKKKLHADKALKIYRKASEEDMERLKLARSREISVLQKTREIIRRMKLEMKLSEVEIQGDNTKGIFYYTADSRVDFRELIKVMAEEFRLRVEMRQIGLRQEAGILGGIGSCGRELCCSTWLTDFKNVSTAAARYQNISLNPMKISGQCGRLKCCLNYELETYMDALKGIPDVYSIETELGVARLQKTDIFKKKMWFSYADSSEWHPVDVRRVTDIIQMNKKGVKPPSLMSTEEIAAAAETTRRSKEMDFVDVVGQSRINERPLQSGKNKKKKKKRPVGEAGAEARTQQPRGPQPEGTAPGTPRTPGNQGSRPPRDENRPPRDPNRPPRDTNRPPRDPNRPPRDENRPPRDPNRPPRDENRPPRDPNRPPRDSNRPPREGRPQREDMPQRENPSGGSTDAGTPRPPAPQGNRPAQGNANSNRPNQNRNRFPNKRRPENKGGADGGSNTPPAPAPEA
jgi:cell fate regulator YaaT (PSP1 superfamily)